MTSNDHTPQARDVVVNTRNSKPLVTHLDAAKSIKFSSYVVLGSLRCSEIVLDYHVTDRRVYSYFVPRGMSRYLLWLCSLDTRCLHHNCNNSAEIGRSACFLLVSSVVAFQAIKLDCSLCRTSPSPRSLYSIPLYWRVTGTFTPAPRPQHHISV